MLYINSTNFKFLQIQNLAFTSYPRWTVHILLLGDHENKFLLEGWKVPLSIASVQLHLDTKTVIVAGDTWRNKGLKNDPDRFYQACVLCNQNCKTQPRCYGQNLLKKTVSAESNQLPRISVLWRDWNVEDPGTTYPM